MKKNYLLLATLIITGLANAQVGIHTDTPKTTLDVTAKRNGTTIDTTKPQGIQAPRLTKQELASISGTVLASSKYGVDQKGALVYITDITGNDNNGTNSQRTKITGEGYYYFNGTIWEKLNIDATSIEPWNVTNTSTAANSNSQNIYQNGSVGIGDFSSANPQAALHILGVSSSAYDKDNIILEGVSSIQNNDPLYVFRRARLTSGAKSKINVGDPIGTIQFQPYDGTNYITNRTGIRGIAAAETVTSNPDGSTTTSADTPVDLMFFNHPTSGSIERMRITAGGNVGIGTSSPNQKLEVNGLIKANALTNNTKAFSTSDLGIYGATNNWVRIATRGADNGESGTSKIAFYTNATETAPTGSGTTPAMVVSNGKVGINLSLSNANTSPGNNLEVVASGTEVSGIRITNIKNSKILGTNTSGDIVPIPINDVNTNIYTNDGTLGANRTVNLDGKNLNFTGSGNATNSLYINGSSGNIGINTNAPSAKLHVKSSTAYNAIQIQDGSEGTGKFLASNATGQATWVNSPLVPIVSSTSDGQQTSSIDITENQYVYKKITLSKGRWMIYVGQLFNATDASDTNNYWVRLTLSSSQDSQENTGFTFLSTRLVSGWLSSIGSSTEKYTFLTGVIPVEVTDASKIIYLRTREFTKTSSSASVSLKTRGNYGENYLFAIPAY